MSDSTRPGPDDSAARAFAMVGWPKLQERLTRYATCALRLAPIEAESCGVVEAVDLVNTLVANGLAGELCWELSQDATDAEVVAYACKKMYGMRSNLRKHAAIALGGDDGIDDQADEGPDALEQLIEHGAIEGARRAVAHDAEASAYLDAMLMGHTREEIADAHGLTPEHAKVVRKRISRRLAALSARINHESEDEPPSSGSRGTDHAQTTQERQGAAPEPHRGAGRAGRRR
jgi:hypothetical protein